MVKSKQSEFEGKIDAYEKQANEYRMMAESKIDKIKADIDARKKSEENKLKNKAEDALKGLL